MPRPRLILQCYALEHGTRIIGPYDDPNRVEAEAWAYLREKCAHLDRATLTPERDYHPIGNLTLKVISANRLTAVGYITILAYLGQEGEEPGC